MIRRMLTIAAAIVAFALPAAAQEWPQQTIRIIVAFGPGLIAEDLPEALPKVYQRLFAQLQSITPSARQ